MATGKRAGGTTGAASGGRYGWWLKGALLVLAALGLARWYWADPIEGYGAAATAYAAKTACSCRHIGGRSLDSCTDDLLPGMGLLMIGEEGTNRVSASVPFVAETTVQYREGQGCRFVEGGPDQD